MVFRGGELEYDNFELIRGQSHVIKAIQRSKTAGDVTISCNTTLCGFFWVVNSMEATSVTLEVNAKTADCMQSWSCICLHFVINSITAKIATAAFLLMGSITPFLLGGQHYVPQVHSHMSARHWVAPDVGRLRLHTNVGRSSCDLGRPRCRPFGNLGRPRVCV